MRVLKHTIYFVFLVDYGSSASTANSDTAPDSSWTPLFKKMIDNHQ